MSKEKKSATNNQWSSLPEEGFDKSKQGKSKKSAENNQWTSTIKNSNNK
ncbi:hypothetical protein [Clostridium felsineum]|uniref:Uncharacterized protein n=1 Tax=Clostridium felsineum TaxID=36839 RepID=A0A1S8KYK2_9CLOT|nr:hypothetical protein [Clostridium felsineum]MCR3760771.1 hypothetical protein [Clostridium felsineum]URZ03870.1 hypothetical protein CLAUR_039360 [Clostridium felsineum]URZ07854.1 hypothetical protein CLROS_032150 [Clostridium felsineum]URZ12885.1 hypothetical protein CROST_036300 [Clostridium felsineum]URZ15146.1 hypothetical protein CLFE_011640 [Clostridium felsineum DSM 794]